MTDWKAEVETKQFPTRGWVLNLIERVRVETIEGCALIAQEEFVASKRNGQERDTAWRIVLALQALLKEKP